jgi:hypothetical protein
VERYLYLASRYAPRPPNLQSLDEYPSTMKCKLHLLLRNSSPAAWRPADERCVCLFVRPGISSAFLDAVQVRPLEQDGEKGGRQDTPSPPNPAIQASDEGDSQDRVKVLPIRPAVERCSNGVGGERCAWSYPSIRSLAPWYSSSRRVSIHLVGILALTIQRGHPSTLRNPPLWQTTPTTPRPAHIQTMTRILHHTTHATQPRRWFRADRGPQSSRGRGVVGTG